jgi:MarR family transcriptional regulator, transcriptional regulator for hemolysin
VRDAAPEPTGLHLSRVSKNVSRGFDGALAAAGGSLPVWLILVSLKGRRHGAQREVADAIGIESATLTHHLNKMEAAGLVTRERDPANRRSQRVALTDAGDALFAALLRRVVAFDEQLRAGFSERDLAQLRRLLDRLDANATKGREDADD